MFEIKIKSAKQYLLGYLFLLLRNLSQTIIPLWSARDFQNQKQFYNAPVDGRKWQEN